MASKAQDVGAFTKSFTAAIIDKQDLVDPGDCQTQSEYNEAPEDPTRGEEISRVAGRKEEKGEEGVGEVEGEGDGGKEDNMDEERGQERGEDIVEGDEVVDVIEEKMEKEREEENVEEGEEESDGEIEDEQEDDVKQEIQLRNNVSTNAEGETEEAEYGESEDERIADVETGNSFQNPQEEEEAVKSFESIYDGKMTVDDLNDKIRTLDMDLSGSLARKNRGSRSSIISRKTTPKYSMSSSRSQGLRGSLSTKGKKILERGARSGRTSSSSGKRTGGITTPARNTDGSTRSIAISRNPLQSDRNLHPTKRDSTLSTEDAPFESLSVVRPHNSEQRLWFSDSEAIYVSPMEPSHSSGYGSAQGESYISPLIVEELSGGIPDPRYDLRGGLQQAHVEHMPKRQSAVASHKGKELNSNQKADGPEAIPIPNGYLLQHLQTTGRALAIPLPVPLLGVYGRPNPPPLKILEEKPLVKKAVVVTKVKSKIKPDAGAKTGKPNGGEATPKDTLRHSEAEKAIPTQELAEKHPKKTVKDHTPESLPSPPPENPIALPPLKNVQRGGPKLRLQGQATRRSVSDSKKANPPIKSSQIPPNQQVPPNPRQYPIQTGEVFYAPQEGGHQQISPTNFYPPARWGRPPDVGQEYYGQSRPRGRNPHELYQQPPNFSSEYHDGNQPRYNTQPPYPTNNYAPQQFYESDIPTLPNISPNVPVPKLGKTSKIQKGKTKTTANGPSANSNLPRADTIAIGNEGRLLKVNTMSRKGEHASSDRKRQQPPAVSKVAANKNKEFGRNEEERRQRDEEAFAWEQYVLHQQQQQQRIADPSMMWGWENAYKMQQPNVNQQTYPPTNHKQANHAPKQKQGKRRGLPIIPKKDWLSQQEQSPATAVDPSKPRRPLHISFQQ